MPGNVRIWHVNDHKKSTQAYAAIEGLCGTQQDFTEFAFGKMLCVAWKDSNPSLYPQVNTAMKKIAIEDLSNNAYALKALQAEEQEWAKTLPHVLKMLKGQAKQGE